MQEGGRVREHKVTLEVSGEVEDRSGPLGDESPGSLAVGLRLLGMLVEVHHGLADAALLQQALVDGRELQHTHRPTVRTRFTNSQIFTVVLDHRK